MESKDGTVVGRDDIWLDGVYGSSLPLIPNPSPDQSWLVKDMGMLENGPEIEMKFNTGEKISEEEEEEVEVDAEDREDASLEIYQLIGLLSRDDGFPPLPFEFVMKNSADYKVKSQQQQKSSYELIQMTRIENFGDFSHPQLDVESGGSNKEKGLGLIRMLLATADLMGSQQYDAAFQMLLQCKQLSTPYGDSMERIGYYFTDAMEEKIELDTRGFINTMTSAENLLNIKEKIKEVEMASISWYQSLPYSKVAHFTANQAILEAVGTASNIHIIDFDIKDGLQWPNLMQSLILRQSGPPEILKITAITRQRFHKTKKAGKRLSSFAKSLNISFTFKMVIINKINDVNSDMFGVDPMEAVAVNASVMLQGLFQEPNSLRLIVDVIASLQPLVFTVIHNEGEHNSISFVKRFIEVLFYYSAIFDSLDAVYERWDLSRVRVERFFVAPGIRNMVAHEGNKRVIRHVEAEVWGSFMKQAGFRGLAFSDQAKYQAGLVAKDFSGG
ncbi:hypothetical protein KI387_025816, partial [Taxus chinensis]